MNREYVLYLADCLDYLLEHLKNRRHRKILKSYRPVLQAYLTEHTKEGPPFTQPLVAHYILQGMILLKKESE